MKEINYGKLFSVGLVLIVIFFILQISALKFASGFVSDFIDDETKKAIGTFEDVYERVECNVDYKEIHYKGFCTKEMLEEFYGVVGYDKNIELLQLCMQNPYAYRYELCNTMEARK